MEKKEYLIKNKNGEVIYKSEYEDVRDRIFEALKIESKDYFKDELKLFEE